MERKKLTNEECHRLIKGYFKEIFPEKLQEFKENPEAMGCSHNDCNYTDSDIFEFMKEERELEDWEIEDIITCMSNEIYGCVFKCCGCGYPEGTKFMLHKLMNCFPHDRTWDPVLDEYRYEGEHGGWLEEDIFKEEFDIDLRKGPSDQPHFYAYLFILYQLETLDVTEHGSNIFGSYLTFNKGHYVKDILDAWYEYAKDDDDGDSV